MPEDTSPLLSTEPIVNSDGTPSRYFLRNWDLQRGLNKEIAGIDPLAARVAVLEAEMDAVEILAANNAVNISTNTTDISTLENRDLVAGTGLTGGGDLTADRTFDLEDTAVTPGSYTNTDLTIDQQGRITAASSGSGGGGGSGVSGDEDWFNVVMLMHFEGADASTTFTDSSLYGVTTTAEANAQIDTDQFKFGSSSGLFDGTADTVDWPDDDRYSMTDQDFTVECWVRFNGDPSGTQQVFASHYNNVGNQRSWFWRLNSDDTMQFIYSTNGTTTTAISSAWNPVGETWYHVAVCRSGADLRMFVDGVQIGATGNISTSNLFNSTDTPRIAAVNSGGIVQVLDGWMDEFRWTLGAARYEDDFSVQTAAWPDGPIFSLQTLDDGVSVVSETNSINFTGTGVTVTDNGGGQASVEIDGGGSGDTNIGGPYEYIETLTLSSVANADVDLPSGYSAFQLVIALTPATDSVNLEALVTNDGFATVETGASAYAWLDQRYDANSGGNAISNSGSSAALRVATNIGSTSNEDIQMIMGVMFPGDTTRETSFDFRNNRRNSANNMNVSVGGGRYSTAEAIDGVRLSFSSGNIETGTIHVYGIKDSAVGIGVVHVQDQKANGTDGGSTAAATTAIRTLNTVVTNTVTGASLATNQITLPAGTYNINASVPGFDVNRHKAHLYNVTDAAIAIVGMNAFCVNTDAIVTTSVIRGQFTIASEKDFEIRHYTQLASATLGRGVAVSDGNVEVYTDVFIEKVG